MIRIEQEYFGINKLLMLAVGIWPYEQSKLTRLQFIFISAALASIIIVQVNKYINKTLFIYTMQHVFAPDVIVIK